MEIPKIGIKRRSGRSGIKSKIKIACCIFTKINFFYLQFILAKFVIRTGTFVNRSTVEFRHLKFEILLFTFKLNGHCIVVIGCQNGKAKLVLCGKSKSRRNFQFYIMAGKSLNIERQVLKF